MQLVTTLLLNILFSGVAVILARYFIPGIHLDNFEAAFVVAAIIAVMSWIVGRILHWTTTPSNFMFGLISFVITAFFVYLIAQQYDWFSVDNFRTTLPFTALLTLVQIMTGVKRG